jgi:AraC-like DNA-binding protein
MSLLGVVDSLMRQSNTVQAALQQLIQHLHINDRGAVVYLISLNQDEVAFGYSVFTNKLPGLMQLFDYSIANAQTILQHLCGPTWRPKRVSFAHSAPINLTPYQKLFNSPLYFDAPRTEIIFSKHWLNTLLLSANATQRMSSEREARLLESDDQQLFVRSVRHAIQTLLLSGDATALNVCRRLRLHERIMRRRLQAQGTSIKQLKSQARFNLACQLLGLTTLSLAEIAMALDYSDTTAFSRAFQQHARVAPATWRKQQATQGLPATYSGKSPDNFSPSHQAHYR